MNKRTTTEAEDELKIQPWVQEFLKRPSHLIWDVIDGDESAKMFRNVLTGIRVLVSGKKEADGRRWLHVSCSHHNRLPSWDELRQVKEVFIGANKAALQVLPDKAKHVNFHPYCLHLWHCADGDVTPDFTAGRPPGML